LFGITERSNTYRLPLKKDDQIGSMEAGALVMLPVGDETRESYLIPRDMTESKFDKFVKPLREAEIKAYEKAIDSTLEKTLANVAVLLSICLATALAPWTSVQTFNATNAQLGSYALLLSISTGFFALISSMTQLANATESAKLLLLLQEKTIGASNLMHEAEEVSTYFSLRTNHKFGFSGGMNEESSPLTWFSLWKSASLLSKLPCLLFGVALMLIPRFHADHIESSWIHFAVKDVNFRAFTKFAGIKRMQRNETRAESLQAAERGSRTGRSSG